MVLDHQQAKPIPKVSTWLNVVAHAQSRKMGFNSRCTPRYINVNSSSHPERPSPLTINTYESHLLGMNVSFTYWQPWANPTNEVTQKTNG